MNKKVIALNIAGILCIASGVYYILAELICVLFCAGRGGAYVLHTVSELGIPLIALDGGKFCGFSPLFRLMNSAFIIAGSIFIIFYPVCYGKFKTKAQTITCAVLAFFGGLGVIMVGFFHGGSPVAMGFHGLGAAFAFVAGNLTTVFTAAFYDKFTFNPLAFIGLCLGAIGLGGAFLTLFFELSPLYGYSGFAERLSIYPIVIWQILSGIYALNTARLYRFAPQETQ